MSLTSRKQMSKWLIEKYSKPRKLKKKIVFIKYKKTPSFDLRVLKWIRNEFSF